MKTLKTPPKNMHLIHLEAVLMPNGEVICNGMTVGWEKELRKYILWEGIL